MTLRSIKVSQCCISWMLSIKEKWEVQSISSISTKLKQNGRIRRNLLWSPRDQHVLRVSIKVLIQDLKPRFSAFTWTPPSRGWPSPRWPTSRSTATATARADSQKDTRAPSKPTRNLTTQLSCNLGTWLGTDYDLYTFLLNLCFENQSSRYAQKQILLTKLHSQWLFSKS